MQLQEAIQGWIEGVKNLVQGGLLNLWQITSPPHSLPPGAKFNARFIKRLSQLKSDIRSLQSQASVRSDGGVGGGVDLPLQFSPCVRLMESQLKGVEKGKCARCLE